MLKKIDFKNWIIWLGITLVVLGLIFLIAFLSGSKRKDYGSAYKNVEHAILNIAGYKSYEFKKSEVVLKMIKVGETFDDFAYQIDTILTVKGNKTRIDSYYLGEDFKEYFGGLFVSPKYTEFMINESESVFFTSKDIFKVIKTYVPTLNEVCDDFEKVKFTKLKDVISKSLSTYIKKHGKEIYEDYSAFFEEALADNLVEEVVEENKTTDKYYKLKMNVKDFVFFESETLIKLKNDKKISDMIVGVASDLIKYLEKTKEYKKIRMTEDEFNSLKYNYEEEIKTFYEKEMTKRINYIQELYSGVVEGNDDKNIVLVFRVDEDGNLVSVITEGVTILDDVVVSNLVNYSISKINKVKNKDIVPRFAQRTSLVSKSRNELYTIFEGIKTKYDEKGVNFFSNILGLDKIKES